MLWVLVILGVIAGQFCYSMRNEIKAARLIKDDSQAYYITRAGILTGLKKVLSNTIGTNEKEENSESNWRVNTEIPTQSFGNGSYKIIIGNESGKVNLNYAGRELLNMLFTSLEVEDSERESIVDAILDWRDSDALHRLNGAENGYYQSLPEPYKCRDGFFRYVDEILLVKGITSKLYHNGLKNFISVVVIPKVIVKGKQKLKRGRININAVPMELLKVLPGMTPQAIENIVSFRQTKDIGSLNDLVTVTSPEIAGGLKNFIDYHYNRFYTIDAEGWTRDEATRQRIRVMVREIPETEKRYRIVQWIDSVFD